MRRLLLFITLCSSVTIFFCSSQTADNANAVFEKVSKSLLDLKTVSYTYKREENYPSEGYYHTDKGEMYIDFTGENSLAGFRFQYKSPANASVFNNSESFYLDEKEKTIQIKRITKASQLEGTPALLNAYAGLCAALPMVTADTSIRKFVSDTTVNNKVYYLLQFDLKNKYLNYYLGNKYSTTTISITFNYKIIIDKATELPVTIMQTNIANKNLNRADFTNINIHPMAPAENSWYYSTYTDKYKLKVQGKPLVMIPPGTMAPDFQFTNYKTNAAESISDHKGKVLMLEFWFKNCGYCIAAVPDMNLLNSEYKNKDFKLFAFNGEDPKNTIDIFVTKLNPRYDIAYGSKVDVSKLYGVQGVPKVVVINKKGVVIYSGEFDMPKIKSAINAAI